MSLFVALAAGTRAWGVASLDPSNIGFEGYDLGTTDVHTMTDLSSTGESDGLYHWYTSAAGNTLSNEVVSVADKNALKVFAPQVPSEALLRTMASRESYGDAVDTVYVSSGSSVVYCDLDVTFNAFADDESPAIDGEDRLVVFARSGRLYVTAGRYVGSMATVEANTYPLKAPVVDVTAPHRLTIRSIPTVANGRAALAFTLAIDGTNAVIDTTLGQVYRDYAAIRDVLTSEARCLLDSGRLFPSLTEIGRDRSLQLTGLGFTGNGVVYDIQFTNGAPDGITAPERLFELDWDGGVTALSYAVGDGAAASVPSFRLGDRKLFLALPSADTSVAVSAAYGANFTPGAWHGEDCLLVTNIVGTVTNFSFTVLASASKPVGHVVSSRVGGAIAVGSGSFSTFAEAKAQALAQGISTIVLEDDLVTTADDYDAFAQMSGSFVVGTGEAFTLDLNGHTISNGLGQGATINNYGKLRIVDSVGGGKVVPYADYFSDADTVMRMAVQNMDMRKTSIPSPELVLAGGTYCGIVTNAGRVAKAQTVSRLGTVVIEPNAKGEPSFIGGDTALFPYEDFVTNGTYYVYTEPYWSPLSGAFIWCGEGATTSWSEGANWRGGVVPGASDFAIFPATTNLWVADLGTGVQIAKIAFQGDTELHGSSDFTSVTLTNGAGRVSGDATLTWSGVLPPSLADVLAANWTGTIVVSEVTSPKLMNNVVTWGTASSKVVFHGVRGYCHAVTSYVMPYELVLEDGSKGYGWKNDAGFTGSVLQFAKLSGAGSFVSPKNTISNYQTIRFVDVASYTGKLDVLGKRVVLGAGAPNASAGSITWSDGVAITVTDGVVHNCAVAAFLGALTAAAEIGDKIATYTTRVVGADEVVVTLPDGAWAELSTADNTITIAVWSSNATVVDGKRTVETSLLTATSSSRILTTRSTASRLKFASFYTPNIGAASDDGMASVTLTLNQNAVPVLGGDGESAAFAIADGLVTVTVSNAQEGLFYRLEHADKPNATEAEWSAGDAIWQVLDTRNGHELELSMTCDASVPAGYYRVVVTDVAPAGWEEAED